MSKNPYKQSWRWLFLALVLWALGCTHGDLSAPVADVSNPQPQTQESATSADPQSGDRAIPADPPQALFSEKQLDSQAAAFGEYRVGPGDELAIEVYGDSELTKTYRVSDEGDLIVRYLGSVSVAGQTTAEITQKLEQLLSPMYESPPRVLVRIEQYKSQRVFVVGAIPPATFPLRGDTTLIEILSQLKGLDASPHVVVYRRGFAEGQGQNGMQGDYSESIQVDLERLLRQGDMSLNFVLQPRDVIYVPTVTQEKRVDNTIKVLGEVKKPDTIELPAGGMTLLTAIVKVGGFSEFAMPSRTRVLRISDGVERTIKVNVSAIMRGKLSEDIQLMPGDVIIVPERTLF